MKAGACHVRHNGEIHPGRVCSDPNLSRLVAVCAWILLFSTFRVAVLLLPSPSFRPLFFLSFNSHDNSGAAVTRPFRPPSVSTAAELRSFAIAALRNVTVKNECFGSSQLRAGFSAIGRPVQMHGEGLLGLHRKIDLLVRRTQSNQVLRVEGAEGCRDGWPDAYNALLYSGPKQCNPKIAAKEQLRAAHRGRAPGVGRAINLHLLDRLPCIVHEAAPTGGLTVSVHLRL